MTNGSTEALNNLIKRIKRAAFGFRNFANCRIRALLYGETRPGPTPCGHSPVKSEEPLNDGGSRCRQAGRAEARFTVLATPLFRY